MIIMMFVNQSVTVTDFGQIGLTYAQSAKCEI